MNIQLWGAGAFGAILGWYTYFINRYRQDDVKLGDLVTLVVSSAVARYWRCFPQVRTYSAHTVSVCLPAFLVISSYSFSWLVCHRIFRLTGFWTGVARRQAPARLFPMALAIPAHQWLAMTWTRIFESRRLAEYRR